MGAAGLQRATLPLGLWGNLLLLSSSVQSIIVIPWLTATSVQALSLSFHGFSLKGAPLALFLLPQVFSVVCFGTRVHIDKANLEPPA